MTGHGMEWTWDQNSDRGLIIGRSKMWRESVFFGRGVRPPQWRLAYWVMSVRFLAGVWRVACGPAFNKNPVSRLILKATSVAVQVENRGERFHPRIVECTLA